jgi:methanogenic corrinoid protein MtbC1
MAETLERGSFLAAIPDPRMRELAQAYLDALLDGGRDAACRLVTGAADRDVPVRSLYLQVFQPVQHEVGRLWQANRITVAVEHFCTAATQLAMSLLFPRIMGGPRNGLRMVACCVGGELHELGMRMVSDFFEMDGWDTAFLGANTPDDAVVSHLEERGADLLCVSVTMTHNVHLAVRLIQAVRRSPGCAGVKVLVGGLPFNLSPGLVRAVGADATARDAEQALGASAGLTGREMHSGR